MRRRILLLALCLIVFTGTAYSSSYSHDMKLHMGESTEISDYIIAYERQEGNNEKTLSVGRWTDTSFLVMEKLGGTDLYDAEGEELDISENLTIAVDRIGNDRDGQFLDLELISQEDIFSSGEMTSSAPSKIIVSQGESTDVSLTIKNTGFLNQTYSLGSESNSSLTTSFNFQDFNVTEVYVPAEGEETVTAEIDVPRNAELGTYDVKLFARNGTELSENIQVEVRGAEIERELSLSIRESYTRTQPGEEIEVPVRVRNGISGRIIRDAGPQGVALNNIEFDITVPDEWDYELTPETISTLGMRDRQQVMLTVDVPEDAQPGDFFVDISASSEKTSMEEPEQVRVNIHEESGMSTVGLILMVISLGMLVFVYRKFGRR